MRITSSCSDSSTPSATGVNTQSVVVVISGLKFIVDCLIQDIKQMVEMEPGPD